MINVHGKLFSCAGIFFILAVFIADAAPRIDLSFINEAGMVSSHAQVGERYRLEVRVRDMQKEPQSPRVPGLRDEHIVGKRQRREVSLIQGVHSSAVFFDFDVRFFQVETITFGPVSIAADDGSTITSAPLTIEVREATSVHTAPKNKVHYFVQWEIEQKMRYVGELIPCVLAFYTNDAQLSIEAVSVSSMNNGVIKLAQEGVWDTVQHVGNTYRRCTWRGYVYANRTGSLLLPVATVTFVSSHRSRSASPWAALSSYLLRDAEQRSTPACALSISAVPPAPPGESCAAVGVIHTIRWEIKTPDVVAGKTVEIKRTIEGSFVPELLRLEAPHMYGTSGTLHESRSSCDEMALPQKAHVEQEFVVHVTQPGAGGIKEQMHWFFNPVTQKYEKIIVEGISWQVASADVAHDSESQDSSEKQIELEQNEVQLPVEEKDKIITQQTWDIQIPFYLWMILLLIPPISIGIYRFMILPLHSSVMRWWNYRSLMRMTLRRIQYARVHQNGHLLAQAMAAFVAHLTRTESGSCELLYEWLVLHHCCQELCESWKLFCHELQEAAFGRLSGDAVELLSERAEEWISILQSIKAGERA